MRKQKAARNPVLPPCRGSYAGHAVLSFMRVVDGGVAASDRTRSLYSCVYRAACSEQCMSQLSLHLCPWLHQAGHPPPHTAYTLDHLSTVLALATFSNAYT